MFGQLSKVRFWTFLASTILDILDILAFSWQLATLAGLRPSFFNFSTNLRNLKLHMHPIVQKSIISLEFPEKIVKLVKRRGVGRQGKSGHAKLFKTRFVVEPPVRNESPLKKS